MSLVTALTSVVTASAIGAAAGWAYLRHIQLPPGPNRMGWSGYVFGHRGCRAIKGIPENTIPAYQYAREQHATGIECDVRLCKSGELVVFHDGFCAPLLECADPKRRILDTPLHELQEMKFRDDPTGTIRVPRAEEVLEFARDNYLKILIEVKTAPGRRAELVEGILRLYTQYGAEFLYEHGMVISFDPILLYQLRRHDPRIATCILTTEAAITAAVEHKIDEVAPLLRALPFVFDHLLRIVSYRIAPWVIGASAIGPRHSMYTQGEHKKWMRRKMLMYLWGFQEPVECVDSMRASGVSVSCDDKHIQYFK